MLVPREQPCFIKQNAWGAIPAQNTTTQHNTSEVRQPENSRTMKILIGGGRGFIGTHLTKMLRNKQHDVLHISRTPGTDKITWRDLQKDGIPGNIGAVVNLAGNNLMDFTSRFNDTFKHTLRASRINTNRDIVNAIGKAANPPTVFIAASGIGFYTPSETAEYTEDSPGGSDKFFLGKLSKDVEESAQLPADSKTRNVVVRIGLALGRDGGAISQMMLPFWFGLGGRISTGKQWFPWIHVDDVAGIIVHAIENENVGGILNATAPHYITNAEFTAAFAKQLYRPAIFPVPEFALNLVYGSERAQTLTTGAKVVPKRTLESGYKFQYPDIKSACQEFGHLSTS